MATAFYAWTAGHAARIAELLGRTPRRPAVRRAERRRAVDAWRTEFVAPDGRVTPHTQANLVRALRVRPGPRRACASAPPTTSRRWSARPAPTSATGFLATPDLLPVLADHGHLDLAYELLLQDTEPSWLAMIDRGATTVWERWDGIDADGVPHESLNHYSKGAVISFLHRYVAGLQRLEPTWRRFRVQPRPGGGIRGPRPSTSRRTAGSRWRGARTTTFALTVTVPPGCIAEVVLPDGTADEVGAGGTASDAGPSYDGGPRTRRYVLGAAYRPRTRPVKDLAVS